MQIRKPRTTQEARMYTEQYGRAKRSARRLPNEWDDKQPRQQRTWKRSRKTQYK